jgi:hypothetical protein
MKHIEVNLNVGVIAPLLDCIKPLFSALETQTALGPEISESDRELASLWREGLIHTQVEDARKFLGLFGAEFCDTGRVRLAAEDADSILRASSAVRLVLRRTALRDFSDAVLAGGEINLDPLGEGERRAVAAYVFLASLQELILTHLAS